MDTNVEEAKMSTTPRTDAATVRMERLDGDIDEVVAAFFARQLERELTAARSATGAMRERDLMRVNELLNQHVDSLREALRWCRGAASNDRWTEENLRHQIISHADEALERHHTTQQQQEKS